MKYYNIKPLNLITPPVKLSVNFGVTPFGVITKVLKLSYVIIFALLSYYILIGSKYERKSVYDRVDTILKKKNF